MFHILTLCGSLRQRSTNKILLEAAARLAPPGMALTLYDGLGRLPHFNPDIDDQAPTVVVLFREMVRQADGLIISSPEYAHGVPGSLKNALDWLVSGSEMPGKPVALFDASTRSSYARDSLREILKTMSAHLVEDAFVGVPLLGKTLSVEEVVADPEMAGPLAKGLTAFEQLLRAREKGRSE